MNKDIKIRDYLINTISDNKEGEKLPSENKIARDFGVSRHKVRSIYDSLEAMGLVYSVQGVGRFAHVNLKEVSLALNSKSFTDKMASDGVDLLTQNLGTTRIEESKAEIYRDMGLRGNIYRVARLRILYGQPAVIHASYLGDETFPHIGREGDSIQSIHAYYKSKGMEIEDIGHRTIGVRFPNSKEMQIFECGSLVPLFNVKSQVARAGTSELIEFTDVVYRSDIFTYRL